MPSSIRPCRARDVDGPRERLVSQGPAALSDAELIALILRTGAPGRDALGMARILLDATGGLRALARASAGPELVGLGPAKRASLQAAFEIGRRVAARRLRRGDPIRTPGDLARHFAPQLRDLDHERFLVVLLDGRYRVLSVSTVSQGTLTASLVHPREVFRPALQQGAAAVVLVHNHPSGDPAPSPEDRAITQRIARAGALLGIPVLDHVVIADGGFRSLREDGSFEAEPGGPVEPTPEKDPTGTCPGGR